MRGFPKPIAELFKQGEEETELHFECSGEQRRKAVKRTRRDRMWEIKLRRIEHEHLCAVRVDSQLPVVVVEWII